MKNTIQTLLQLLFAWDWDISVVSVSSREIYFIKWLDLSEQLSITSNWQSLSFVFPNCVPAKAPTSRSKERKPGSLARITLVDGWINPKPSQVFP